jgi:IS4 transposase
VARFRVVVVPGRDEAMTRRCTNLPRTPFPAPLVARLYRFRWQVELCFKEWTSYANLHKCDTANLHHILTDLVSALLRGVGLLVALRRGLACLLANARRANVPREYRTGRLRAALATVGSP